MRREVVSVGQFARHARLHVGVVGFRLEGNLDVNGAVLADLDDSGMCALLHHHRIPVVETEYRAEFLVLRIHFIGPDDVMGARFVLAGRFPVGNQDVAVVQHVAVARIALHFPNDLAVLVEQQHRGLAARDQEGVANAGRAFLADRGFVGEGEGGETENEERKGQKCADVD